MYYYFVTFTFSVCCTPYTGVVFNFCALGQEQIAFEKGRHTDQVKN